MRSEARKWKKKAATGFTLIEVVVALAILGIGLTVIIELFSGGLRLARTSQEYTKAMNFARMKMEEISSKQNIEEGSDEGKCDDDMFHWQVQVKKLDILPVEKDSDFKPPVDLFQVRVDILWKSGAQERSASIESYKASKSEADEKQS
ncbi:MAG: type II secretion system protein [Thermodesulfobacteriota bacterium]|jgi:general secretion pathway protein I